MQILNWENKTGVHCGSVAIQNVINYYGVNYPEEMCFGLGAGLGFFYNKLSKSSPSEVIHLRAPDMEPNFFSKNNQVYKWLKESSPKEAEKKLKQSLDNLQPVFLQTDLFYLKYYNSKIHFPGHVVVCVGYDDIHKKFILSDTNFKDLKEVSYKDLDLSRSSKAEPYPLQYNWFTIDSFVPFKNINSLIYEAIKLNSRNFLNGQNSLRGTSSVFSILDWVKNLENWSNLKDKSSAYRFAYQIIARRGSKGGGFRCIYSDFLKIAEKKSSKIKNLGLFNLMLSLATEWERLAYLLKELSLEYNHKLNKKVIDLIRHIYSEELKYHLLVTDQL